MVAYVNEQRHLLGGGHWVKSTTWTADDDGCFIVRECIDVYMKPVDGSNAFVKEHSHSSRRLSCG